jgi:His-Xaa-Ser system radical SAM maturase HxsB
MPSKFFGPDTFETAEPEWEFLPFQFERLSPDRVLLTNMVGEHLFVSADEFAALMGKRLPSSASLTRRLRGRQIVREVDEELPLELLALKTRTRFRRLSEFTSLHIFVVSLRCEHSCPYCQVSRQSSDMARFDMSPATAERALELTFSSPSRAVKIEFQGGEPLLNFGLVKKIVLDAEALNLHYGKDLQFVIATNLALLDDQVLDFCRAHDVYISTSLDGPRDIHNRNRPRPGNNSWELATEGIRRVRESLGADRISALMTTTERSFGRVREIIDTYLEQGLTDVFLRPLSPYGFAIKTKQHGRYDVERWLEFYADGLDYVLDLNRQGLGVSEQYAALILKKILTSEDPGYVDLASPAGIGRSVLVYNYDGDVYASDEGRMLAEMGDTRFRLGNLHEQTYPELILSDAMLDPLEQSFTWSVPMCSDCAFEPYCGADPTFHYATQGDYVGRKPLSAFHQRNSAIFRMLLERYEDDPFAHDVFLGWSGR